MNILITNVGRRGYLTDYFKQIPEFQGRVYTSDCDRTASGLYGHNDGHFILPRPVDDERRYVNELIALCHREDIQAVLPVIDPELYILSRHLYELKREGITVVVSDRRVLEICFDKLKMNAFLEEIGVAFPRTYVSVKAAQSALARGELSFPLVLKPILGSGSVDTFFVDDEEKLCALFWEGMLIQEKLVGAEYGTDTFNSFAGVPLRCVIKRKISMRSGETDKSISVHNAAIQDTLLLLAEKLGHIGNLDCDIIVSNDRVYVIDLNPRFGGGYPATHAIGVNLVELLYRLLQGETVQPEFGNYADDILVMKTISVNSTVIHHLI